MSQAGFAAGSLEAVGSWIASQRWYGEKGRQLVSLAVVAAPRLGEVELSVVELSFADGSRSRYFLPLVVVASAPEGAVVAVLPEGVLADAACIPAALERMASALLQEETVQGLKGERTAIPARGDVLPCEPSRLDQSNSSFYLGNAGFAKLFRKLPDGTSPDWEIGKFLAGRGARVPASLGALLLEGVTEEPLVLIQVWERVAGAKDAWEHAQDLLGELLDSGVPADLATEEPVKGWCRTLGVRTGELHRALVGSIEDVAFAPHPLTEADLEKGAEVSRELGTQALELLSQVQSSLGLEEQSLAIEILARREEIVAELGQAPSIDPHAVRIRCHGDYHLGQVLWKEGDALILDFEGEPVRSLAERRRRQSPLKDVAGMLRSLDYAAQAALKNAPGHQETALAWRDAASQAFLAGYLAAVAGTPLVPSDPAEFQALLDFHLAEKLLYELLYELRHRPDWVGIPLAALARACVR